tara:strand:- start:1309 stop:1500 length:192 start_codon:yes stop_codon:yes gene_type:complete
MVGDERKQCVKGGRVMHLSQSTRRQRRQRRRRRHKLSAQQIVDLVLLHVWQQRDKLVFDRTER